MDHKKSDGTTCSGCPPSCEDRDTPIVIGGIECRGCCAMRTPHGTFAFDVDGNVTQEPLCCAEHEHFLEINDGNVTEHDHGVNPDKCSAHGGKPEWAIKVGILTTTLIPITEPDLLLTFLDAEILSVPADTTATIVAEGKRITAPRSIVKATPKPNGRADVVLSGRGFQLLRSGTVVKTIPRQLAERKVMALVNKTGAALDSLNGFVRTDDSTAADEHAVVSLAGKVFRGGLRWNEDTGDVEAEVVVMEKRVNPHNPEAGGAEWHHRDLMAVERTEVAASLRGALGLA